MPVTELVNYGLTAPRHRPFSSITALGTYSVSRKKIARANTVITDVRNHYEATIGHFEPPSASNNDKYFQEEKAKARSRHYHRQQYSTVNLPSG
jgi:predicted sulfurtransferase